MTDPLIEKIARRMFEACKPPICTYSWDETAEAVREVWRRAAHVALEVMNGR